MDIFYLLLDIFLLYYLWLSVLATIAVRFDRTLDTFQKNSQTLFLWVLPIFGSVFVLHLICGHYPDAIPHSWIPWPFKKMIYGKIQPRHRNRDNDDSTGMNDTMNQHNHSDSGGDDGGGGGGGD